MISDQKKASNRAKLAVAIGKVVQNFTLQLHQAGDHMPEDEVIAVLAYCTGSAIGAAPQGYDKRSLGELAVKWMDDGLNVSTGRKSATIITIPKRMN